MDLLEAITGNRVNYAMNTIGGARRDIDDAKRKMIPTLDDLVVKDGAADQFPDQRQDRGHGDPGRRCPDHRRRHPHRRRRPPRACVRSGYRRAPDASPAKP